MDTNAYMQTIDSMIQAVVALRWVFLVGIVGAVLAMIATAMLEDNRG